jgi:uncharacterized membrane protein YesL
MSDAARLPPSPRLGSAMRTAAVDFYYHSLRLVLANVVWGVAFFAVLAVWAGVGPIALLLAPLLAIPWVGVVRLAALIARGDEVVLSDAFTAYRRWLVPTLVAGFFFVLAGFVLLTNLAVGLHFGGVPGWSFATLSGWGLVVAWLVALSFWPLLVDPRRDDLGAVAKLRLAAILVIAFPLRIAALGAVAAVLAVVSTVAIAAIVTISVAYIALVSCRYVLPAADRLERRIVPGPGEDAD